MRALAIELNDAGITVADASGVLAVEPGYAFVERGRIQTGTDALRQARLRPRQVSNRYWGSLGAEPRSGGVEGGSSAAELAFAQLQSLWQRFGAGVTDVILVVPGSYRGEQLGLLLGLAQECAMPVRALVDVAAAASMRPFPGHQLLYVDASLHRVAVTQVEQGADAAVRSEQDLATGGLAGLTDSFVRRFAEVFVLATRLDPFHHAETEQQLYDRVPEWLDRLRSGEHVECVLRLREQEFRVTVEHSVLGVAQGFYRAVLQLIAQSREPGHSLVVQLSARLAALPGLATELARLDDAHIERLEPGHAARSVLLGAEELASAGADGVKLLKHLSWRAPAAEIERAAQAPVPEPRAVVNEPPTHVVYGGIVYRVDARGLLIGREAAGGRRTIVVAGQDSGVSREHCELVLRDGELRLRDLSRYGTFVNEKRVSGETALERADVIRIGSPGAELTAVNMEPADGA